MDFLAKGKIVKILPPKSGMSQQGKEWMNQDYILEHEHGRFPRCLCFRVFGRENIAKMGFQDGEEVTIHLSIECHEYNGNFYNSIECWKVDRRAESAMPSNMQPGMQYQQPAPVVPQASPDPFSGMDNDAPF